MEFQGRVALVIADGGRAEDHTFHAGRERRIAQMGDRIGEALGSRVVGGQAAAIVHAVADEEQIRLRSGEGAIQSLADGGATKAMPLEVLGIFLRCQIAGGLAAKPEIDHLGLESVRRQPAFEISHVIASLCDAVAKEHDALHAFQFL